ncbi:MAG: hypothetical protein KUG72_10885 [Pseudomonadales bacterium]|nr:hypothetical protein [Pseudomonadales bacterium]
MLSKENAALCTLYTLIIEGFFFVSASARRQGGLSSAVDSKGAATLKLRNQYRWLIRCCFIIIPLVIGALGLLYKLDSFLAGYEVRPFSLYERLLSQIHILFYYLQLIVFPRLSEYSLYHDDYPIIREFGWGTFVRLSVILGTVGICVLSIAKKQTNVILFGVAWFFVSHAMESTIIPLEMIFEHRNYLAVFGLSLILSIFFVSILPNLVNSKIFTYSVLSAICILLLFVLSVRVNTWRTDEQLTLVNVTAHPLSARSHTDRANTFGRYGNGEGMIEHLTIAYQLQPWNPGAAIHRLSAACVFGLLDRYIVEEAISAADGAYLTAYTSLAMDNLITNISLGRCVISEQDMFLLLESLDSGVAGKSQQNQARKQFFLARYYQHLGEIESAIKAYDLAIAVDHSMTAYSSYKIRFLIGIGMYEKAESDILLLIERDKVSSRDGTARIQSLFSLLYSSKHEKN